MVAPRATFSAVAHIVFRRRRTPADMTIDFLQLTRSAAENIGEIRNLAGARETVRSEIRARTPLGLRSPWWIALVAAQNNFRICRIGARRPAPHQGGGAVPNTRSYVCTSVR